MDRQLSEALRAVNQDPHDPSGWLAGFNAVERKGIAVIKIWKLTFLYSIRDWGLNSSMTRRREFLSLTKSGAYDQLIDYLTARIKSLNIEIEEFSDVLKRLDLENLSDWGREDIIGFAGVLRLEHPEVKIEEVDVT